MSVESMVIIAINLLAAGWGLLLAMEAIYGMSYKTRVSIRTCIVLIAAGCLGVLLRPLFVGLHEPDVAEAMHQVGTAMFLYVCRRACWNCSQAELARLMPWGKTGNSERNNPIT